MPAAAITTTTVAATAGISGANPREDWSRFIPDCFVVEMMVPKEKIPSPFVRSIPIV